MMVMQKIFLFLVAVSLMCCKQKASTTAATDAKAEQPQTPLTVTTITIGPLSEYVDLNATASYLESNIMKSSANGYLEAVNIKLGQEVKQGMTAFILKTREARALGNTINRLDSSFHFSGAISIRASATGFVKELNHHAGDYVIDG